ncbi:TPA: hypothetical protein ACH3X1_015073 [Trebouxia sp. C0004]
MGAFHGKPADRQIGEGTFATVCVVANKDDQGQAYAVKRLKRQSSVEEVGLFNKEIDILSSMDHENIVAFKGTGKQEDADYLMQEYIAGGTVRQMILKQMSHPLRRVYTDSDCLRWSMDVARALMYLHSGAAGSMILHRDINPDNIMLTSPDPHQSDAKLVDFGLHTSIPQLEDCSPDGCLLPSLRGNGSIGKGEQLYSLTGTTGSLMYMAPEVLLGKQYNEKADIFAVGMIIFELFSNNLRLLQVCAQRNRQKTIVRYAHKVARGTRPTIPPDMPEELADIIQACWHQKSSERPSASALLASLEHLQASGVIQDIDNRRTQPGCMGLFKRRMH